MCLAGIREYLLEKKTMSNSMNQRIWVAVRVQRGFVTAVRAYGSKHIARRQEQSWRRHMNPDYDETAILRVHVKSCR